MLYLFISFLEFLVFSAAHRDTLDKVFTALLEISSKFPIGVATIYKTPNLVFLPIVNYLNKLLIIFLNLTLFVSCTSNIPNNTFDSNKVISIDKPKVTYEVKKLPKSINIFLLDTKGIKEKEFINGFLTNYY